MAKALAVFSATWNGVPLIYSGQELPNMDSLAFFEKDPIKWNTNGTNALHDFYKTLFHLHATHPALRGGDETVKTIRLQTSEEGKILAYLRRKDEREVLVVINLSPNDHLRFDITDTALTGLFKNVFGGAANDFTNNKSFEMQAWEYQVYEK